MKLFHMKFAALWIAAMVWAGSSVAQAHELKSLEIVGDGSQAYVKLRFASIGFAKDFPSYFQKNDASGVLVTSFLETGSAFALGKYTPAPGNPWIEEIRLKRFSSPSGKVFLGLELKLKKSPEAGIPMTPMPNGVLKLLLDKNSKQKYSWSIEKSSVAPIASAKQPVDPKPAAAVRQPVDPGPVAAASKSVEAQKAAPKKGGLIAAALVPAAAKDKAPAAAVKEKVPAPAKPTAVVAAPPKSTAVTPPATAKPAAVAPAPTAKAALATPSIAAKPAPVAKTTEMPTAAPKKGSLVAAGLAPAAVASASAMKEKASATTVASTTVAAKPAPAAVPTTKTSALPAAKKPETVITAVNPELASELLMEKQKAEAEKQSVEEEEQRIVYNSYGRRDPFIPVEEGSVDIGIDVDHVRLVGVVWRKQPLAVLEHTLEAGVSFTVKPGDPVHNGRVSRITRDAVTFDINEYGIPRSYTLKLASSQERTKK